MNDGRTPVHPRSTLLGFTLIELSVALTIAAITTAVATSVTVQLIRTTQATEDRARAEPDARRVVSYVSSRLKGIGGGGMRPWHAIWFEDGNDTTNTADCAARNGLPACGGSDRLTVVESLNEWKTAGGEVIKYRRTCTVTGGGASHIVGQLLDPTEYSFVDPGGFPGNGCCFDWWLGGEWSFLPPHGPDSTQFEGAPVLLLSAGGFEIAHATTRSGSCDLGLPAFSTAASGQASGLRDRPAGATSYADYGTETQLQPIRVFTLFRHPGTDQLLEWEDRNGNASVDSDEVQVLAPNIYDLQFALGYDGAPEDGALDDDSSAGDEWLGNAAGDGLGSGGLTGVDADKLRMAEVGLVVGQPSPRAEGSTAQVLNGNAITLDQLILRSARSRLLFRNLYVFY